MSGSSSSSSSIALLTPYDGGNLGDAAIQDALIANLRALDANVQLYGITLNPVRTSARHHIPCFPLAVISRPYYQPAPAAAFAPSSSGQVRARAKPNFVQRIKRKLLTITPFRQLRALLREVGHIARSYRFLRQVNVLAVAGGGQLDEEWGGAWGHPYALFKWTTLARLAGASVVVLSVGACQIEGRLTRLFLRRALSLATYRSYRDEGSKQLALAITPLAEGPVVPDIAFSLPVGQYKPVPSASAFPLRIAFSPISYGHPGLWPTPNAPHYERYITELAAFASFLLQSGASIVLFSSSSPDELIFAELRKRLDSRLRQEDRARILTSEASSHGELLALFQSVDYVVSSRLHALLLSFLVHKPAIAISYDRKVTCLMEEMGQAAYCFDIKSVTSDNLREAFSEIQTNRQHISSKLSLVQRGYNSAVRSQYQVVRGMFSCESGLIEGNIDGPAVCDVDAK